MEIMHKGMWTGRRVLYLSVDAIRAVFGAPHAITVAGTRYGKPPMPFRRDQPEQPPIPGVSGYGYDAAVNRPAIGGTTGKKPRGGGGVSRNRRPDGIAGTAEARPWWDADDERGEKGGEI